MGKRAIVFRNNLNIEVFEDGRWVILLKIFQEEWGDYSILFCSDKSYDFFADSPELINVIRGMKNCSLGEVGQNLTEVGYSVEFRR